MAERNIRLVVQYDGTEYAGFQIQPNRPTIQGALEEALRKVSQEEVRVIGSGRTDAGVHAMGQVVNFRTKASIPVEKVPIALNSVLPKDITVSAADEVPPEFHARYAATGKVYRYRILNREVPSPFLCRYTWHVRSWLSTQRMRRAGKALLGEHDFSSFCAAGDEAETHVRELRRCDIMRRGETIDITLEANGFLYMMVRNIVGTLVEVGRGHLEPEGTTEILAARDRSQAGPTAPPQGLLLLRVDYPPL